MEAYATAHLGHTDVAGESIDAFGADALTVNGYPEQTVSSRLQKFAIRTTRAFLFL